MVQSLFRGKGIAVVGASRHPLKPGRVLFSNLLSTREDVYPVNPNADVIMGRKAYRSVKEIEDDVDVCFVAVKAEIVPKVVKECGEKGVKWVVIISGGFSEIGRKDLESRVREVASNYGMRVIGPNCLGVYSPSMDGLFIPRSRTGRPKEGDNAVISQSGALGVVFMDTFTHEGMGVSYFFSLGNMVDVNELDALAFVREEGIRRVLMYLERVSDGRRLRELVRGVDVVIMKGGRTESGKRAALTHTASLAGDYRVFEGVMRKEGALLVEGIEEAVDAMKVLHYQRPRGKRVAIVTNGGGIGIVLSDMLESRGLDVPELSLDLSLPSRVSTRNPIDLTGDATAEWFAQALEGVKGKVDMVVLALAPQTPGITEEIADVVYQMNREIPVYPLIVGGDFGGSMREAFRRVGLLPFHSAETLVKVLSKLVVKTY